MNIKISKGKAKKLCLGEWPDASRLFNRKFASQKGVAWYISSEERKKNLITKSTPLGRLYLKEKAKVLQEKLGVQQHKDSLIRNVIWSSLNEKEKTTTRSMKIIREKVSLVRKNEGMCVWERVKDREAWHAAVLEVAELAMTEQLKSNLQGSCQPCIEPVGKSTMKVVNSSISTIGS